MSEKKGKYPSVIYLRSYPKIIFFWPLFVSSFVLWLIQWVQNPVSSTGINTSVLGSVWFIIFFINIFVTAFDFSSTKFFVLVLAILLVILLVIFIVLPNVGGGISLGSSLSLYLGLPWEFYFVMTLILGLILGIVIISTRFDYYKIERNEIYHKTGIFSTAERFPVKSLRFTKSIPDVFEFFMLRAGSLIISPGKVDEVMFLNTVLNINKKEKQLDWLLSHVSVEPDEIDP